MGRDLITMQPAPAAQARLFCLHHAGGGAALFSDWPRLLAPSIQVAVALLPGRERLAREPPIAEFGVAVDRICAEIQALSQGLPFAIFGHSLGAVIAFEVCCRLEREGPRAPECLVLSGRGPVHRDADDVAGASSALAEDELVALLHEMGGTPPEVLANREMLDLLLPRIRADFRLAESYRWDGHSRSNRAALVLGGKSDSSVGTEALGAWSELMLGGVTVQLFEGDHFFVASCKRSVCGAVLSFLERSLLRP